MIDQTKYVTEEEAVYNLALGIVKKTVEDYAKELGRIREDYRACPPMALALEKWFFTEWGQLLCFGHGEAIVREERRKAFGDANMTIEQWRRGHGYA